MEKAHDRTKVLASLHRQRVDTDALIDWLGSMKDDSFWFIPKGAATFLPCAPIQKIYMEEWWRIEGGKPEHLLNRFYSHHGPMFYLARQQGAVMGQALAWIEEQLPYLKVLHELEDEDYHFVLDPHDIYHAQALHHHKSTSASEFTKWLCCWAQFNLAHAAKGGASWAADSRLEVTLPTVGATRPRFAVEFTRGKEWPQYRH